MAKRTKHRLLTSGEMMAGIAYVSDDPVSLKMIGTLITVLVADRRKQKGERAMQWPRRKRAP